jgi:hypothetical protein
LAPSEGFIEAEGCGHETLIETIITWSKAYPIEVFPLPPFGEHGESVDACSARMGRHIISRLMDLIPEARNEL